MFKKLLTLFVIFILSVATFVGCGQNAGISQSNSTNQSSETVSTVNSTANSTVNSTVNSATSQKEIFLNVGVDIVDYVNQDKLTINYKIKGFTLISGGKFTSTSGAKELDSISFPMAYQMGATGTPFTNKGIVFNANKGNKVVVYTVIGSSSATSGKLNLSTPTGIVNTIIIEPAFQKYEFEIPSSGEFAISSGDVSINVYGIKLVGDNLVETSANNGSSNSSNSSNSSSGSNGNYTTAEQAILTKADNAITWQIPDVGGWDKAYDTHIAKPRGTAKYNASSGWTAKGGGYLGTIDNGGTYKHMNIIAQAYQINKDAKYLNSVKQAIGFFKNLQTEKGGFTQVYPKRGNYSDYVTINDDAMTSVMRELKTIYENKLPYKDMFTETERTEIKGMFDKAVDYLLKSQIVIKGEKAGWCAQHDPLTYEPKEAREYERPSVSGSESIDVIKLLLSLTDNQQAVDAGMAALRWFDSHKLENKGYNNKGVVNAQTGETEYIYDLQGSTIWYRFYDLEEGKGFFSDRKSNEKWADYNGYFYDIKEISEERRTGYSWMGKWAQSLIDQYLK